MKYLITLFVLFSLKSHAEYRSTSDQIFSPDYMSETQNLQFDNELGRKEMTLESPHGGRRLLTDKKRSIVLIQTIDELLDLSDPLVNRIISVINKNKSKTLSQADLNKYYVFANFVHSALFNTDENEFYIALIPRNAQFTDVALQVEWFGEGAGAHSQIRFQFNKPITIIPQESDSYPILTLDNGDLIYSLQAIRVEGGEPNWDPFKGLMGEFSNALQVFSTQAKAKLQINTSYVESFSIKDLNSKQRKAIFENALKISNEEQEEGIYNTVFNSCVTQALRALKVSLPKINSQHFNPYSVINMLGLATDGRYEKKQSLNQEFQFLVKSSVMTMEKIENTRAAKKLAPFLPIIESPAFDKMIANIALFIIDNHITYPQVETVLKQLESGKSISDLVHNKGSEKLIYEIQRVWTKNFPKQPFESFFATLQSLKTQDL